MHGMPSNFTFPFEQPKDGHFLTWGPELGGLYAAVAARTGSRVACVGNPNFDRYAGRRKARTGPVRRVLLLTCPVDRALPLSSALDPLRHISQAAEVLASFLDLDVTVHLHPSESAAHYHGLIGSFLPRAKITQGGPIDACLDDSDLVIGYFSTVLMEGMLLGLPVAALNFSRFEFPPPFDGRWGIPLLRSPAEIATLLGRAQEDSGAFRRSMCARHEEVIERFVGRVDGGAAARVSKILESIASGAPSNRAPLPLR